MVPSVPLLDLSWTHACFLLLVFYFTLSLSQSWQFTSPASEKGSTWRKHLSVVN